MSQANAVSALRTTPDISPAEWAVRVDLAAAHRLAELSNWTDLIFNHFTVRVPGQPDHFLIKPHDLTFGEVTASNLRKIDLAGAPVGHAQNVNPAAFTIHSAVYRPRPDINAVMHLHSAPGAALSALQGGLRFLTQESCLFYNRIGYHAFEGIALDTGECDRIGRALGPHKALILRNHGLLTCGTSVADAVLRLRMLIMSAEVQLQIAASGETVTQPDPEVCERTAQQFDRALSGEGWTAQWNAVLRMLDAKDPGYRS